MKYYKNADKLNIDPVLKGYLSKFKTIEDFRVVEPELNEMLQGVGSLNRSKFLHRHRSVSESEGVAVAGNSKYHRPNTTITNRSDYIGPQNSNSSTASSSSRNANQYQHQPQYQSNSNNNRRRTGSFGSGTVRIRSGSLGNKPQVVRRTGSRNELNRVQTSKTPSAAPAPSSSSSSTSVDRKPKSEK